LTSPPSTTTATGFRPLRKGPGLY